MYRLYILKLIHTHPKLIFYVSIIKEQTTKNILFWNKDELKRKIVLSRKKCINKIKNKNVIYKIYVH